MKKKILFVIVIALLGAQYSKGQQLSQYSQYMQNPYIINPATTGMYSYMDVNLAFRKQWAGFDSSPTTSYISAHSPLKKKSPVRPLLLRISDESYSGVAQAPGGKMKHGLGGSFTADEYGAFTNNTLNLSYALHLPVSDKMNLSIGVAAGASMLRLDQSKVTLTDPNDNTYNTFVQANEQQIVPDLKAGLYLYSENLQLGYATNQLLQNEVYFGNTPTQSKLHVHHFFNAGYKIEVNDNFALTPGFLVKFVDPAPVSYDINLKADLMEKFWFGVSYRANDAIVPMLGLTIKDFVKFGYSYDYTTSDLSNYSSGSHEIMLGFMLFK